MGAVIVAAVVVVAAIGIRGARSGRARRRLLSTPLPPPIGLEAWLGSRLTDADVDVDPSAAVRAGAGALAVAAVLGAGAGLVGVLLVPTGLAVAAAATLHGARGRRDHRRRRELPLVLEAVARSLRSGATVPVAVREAAAGSTVAAADLAACVAAVDRGQSWDDALAAWATRRPEPGVRLAVGALSVALGSGGAPARAVDGVAATLRDRGEVDREVQALATQARTSAVVVTLAPLAFGALGLVGDERTAAFLLATPAGLTCLVLGVGLDVLGALWMRRVAGGPR